MKISFSYVVRGIGDAYDCITVFAKAQGVSNVLRGLGKSERGTSLVVLTEKPDGDVSVQCVELAGYLNRSTRSMAPEQRDQFIDAAGAHTAPNEVRVLVVTKGGTGKFFTFEVAS